jgi:2-polyprenyl-3-methyl-5-hydroxy-6-metoxy-1,4-benzoquinol methylase
MEYVVCNLCGADNTKFRFLVRDRNSKEKSVFNLVECKTCGLVYLNPRPTKEEINEYYPPWYHSRAEKEIVDIEKTMIWGIPWREAMQKKAKPILRHKKEGRILDIGCGDGSLLKFMKELGWETHGIDFNEGSANYAREVLGLDVFAGRLEEVSCPEDFFDIIILFHVLEHLPDPLKTLERVRPLLKEDGVLLIEVPNFASFEARVFRSRWIGIAAPVHLHQFAPHTLEAMLKSAGFNTIELGFITEQTRYVAGFSESLRYFLMDWGLYPLRKKHTGSKNKEDSGNACGSSWNNSLHSVEYVIFYSIAYIMDKLGLGSNLLAAAKKKVQ